MSLLFFFSFFSGFLSLNTFLSSFLCGFFHSWFHPDHVNAIILPCYHSAFTPLTYSFLPSFAFILTHLLLSVLTTPSLTPIVTFTPFTHSYPGSLFTHLLTPPSLTSLLPLLTHSSFSTPSYSPLP